MKQIVILAAFMMVLTPSNAQERKKEKDKFATFGFDLGVNRSNLSFGSTQTDGDQITNGLGYRLGVVSNFQLTRRLSLAPKAELSFNASRLSQEDVNYSVNPTNLELIAHAKYKFRKGRFSPYIIAGPNFRVPVNNNIGDNIIPTREDVAIDVGIGLDVPLINFRVSPELRYSFGLKDINRDSGVSDLKYHNIALVLIFSGM